MKWYRGTNDGTFGGAPCDPGVSSPPCVAIGDNDAIDGHFRVYVSADDPRISATSFHKEPDGIISGSDDLDNPDQRDHVVTDAEAPSGTILYFLTLNWDILAEAPLIEAVVRDTGNRNHFVIFGSYFNLQGAQVKLCEAADACASPVAMNVTSRTSNRIEATAPSGVTGTRYVAVENPDGLRAIWAAGYPFP